MSEPVTHEDEARAMEEIRLAMNLLYLTIQAIAEFYPYLPPTAISTAMINVGVQHGIRHEQSTIVADYLHEVAELVTRGQATPFTGGDDVRHCSQHPEGPYPRSAADDHRQRLHRSRSHDRRRDGCKAAGASRADRCCSCSCGSGSTARAQMPAGKDLADDRSVHRLPVPVPACL